MDDIFNLILLILSNCVNVMKGFEISAFGFTTNLWSFVLYVLILHLVIGVILVVGPRTGSHFGSARGSERAPDGPQTDYMYLYRK